MEMILILMQMKLIWRFLELASSLLYAVYFFGRFEALCLHYET